MRSAIHARFRARNSGRPTAVRSACARDPAVGKACGDGGYDDRADFTGDCTVSIQDFNLLKGNFGSGGAPPIRPGGG